LSFAIDYADVN